MTNMLLDGPNALVSGTVYAMPGKSKIVLCDSALTVSTTTGGTFTAVAATTTSGALIPGGSFVKATTTSVAILSNQ